MRKLKFIILTLFAFTVLGQAQQEIPDWFKEEVATRVGTWVTSNSEYQGENEPYDSYGMVWEMGPGNMSMTGSLYGLVKGKKTVPFWEFRTFWHPGDQKVYAYQWGLGGAVGIGEMLPGLIDQVFYNPDGNTVRQGHKSEDKDGKHITASFDIDKNGAWTARRKYTWERVNQ